MDMLEDMVDEDSDDALVESEAEAARLPRKATDQSAPGKKRWSFRKVGSFQKAAGGTSSKDPELAI